MEALVNQKELICLIYLLEDEDKEVYQNVSEKLISFGEPVLPQLESASNLSLNQLVNERLEQIVHKIYYKKLAKQFEQWLYASKRNLLEGIILIAIYQHPDLNERWIKRKINDIAQNIYFELSLAYSPIKSISIFNTIFFDNYELSVANSNDHNPRHFFINHVLSFKTAEPLLIGILYYFICQQLELPVKPVLIEEQLFLVYNKKQFFKNSNHNNTIFPDKSAVHFFINPAEKGAILTNREMKQQYYSNDNYSPQNEAVLPCSSTDLVQLLLEKLGKCYHQNKEYNRSQEIKQLANMMI